MNANRLRGERPQTTLVLGGGGARGLAHLGVIEAVLEAGFPVERIVGVSVGSMLGALYAFHGDIAHIQREVVAFLCSPEFQTYQQTLCAVHPMPADEDNRTASRQARVKDWLRNGSSFQRLAHSASLLPGAVLEQIVDQFLPDADISDAQTALSVVAVDLRRGRKVVLDRGPLRAAVRASASLPGIFPPVEWDGMLLCDIGVFYSLPTTVARGYNPDYVIASDVGSPVKPISDCPTALDVLLRMDEIGESLFRKHVRTSADLIVHPDVAGVKWFDFSASEELIQRGRAAGRRAIATATATVAAVGAGEAARGVFHRPARQQHRLRYQPEA